jgi:colicin import membrane protein
LIAQAPTTHRFSAGVLALLVHVAFLALLVFGISWQTKEPPGLVVDLWSSLPAEAPKPAVAPPPRPVTRPAPEPIPLKKMEPKPAPPAPMQNADIALKQKRKLQDTQLKLEKRKQQEAKQLEAQKNQMLQDQIKKEEKAQLAQAVADQQAQAALARVAQAKQSAAQQSVVDEYTQRIQSKIRQKVNQTLCGEGNPQLEFDITLLPTGQLRSDPVLRKGSGIAACDMAVKNAISQSDPLPVPPQPEVFSRFRELHLKFRPNE